MKFSHLAKNLVQLEAERSRNQITNLLAVVFKASTPAEIDKICYLLLGELLPAYRGVDFNVAEKMMVRVLAHAYNRPLAEVARRYKQVGDLGDLAFTLAESADLKPKNLSVTEVYERLLAVTSEAGTGSQERRVELLAKLLQSLDALSAKFVARLPVGKLRLGFSEATMLDTLSLVEVGSKAARAEIERAYNVTADIGLIAREIKSGGLAALTKLKPTPGIPIRPALAERVPSTEEIIAKLGPEVGVESKLDGFRIAIHRWREAGEDRVALFSRNLENTTNMFPEIVAAARALPAKEFILDGEAIGFDPASGKFAPFQETMQRKRKHGIAEMAKKIPLTVFVFDVLHLEGRSLLEESFTARRQILEKLFTPAYRRQANVLQLSRHQLTTEPQVLEAALKEALGKQLEGIVVKNLSATYQAGSRGFHWVKLKAGTAALGKHRAGGGAGLPDTLDCLVLGVYRGRGARAAFGVGGLLLGARGKNSKFYSLTRLGSGLSESQLQEIKKLVGKLKVKEQPLEYEVLKEAAPDFWLAPALVVEVLADEISFSPRHTAGLSLRFPRLVRFRSDKGPNEVTTVEEVQRLYQIQKGLSTS